MTLTHGIKEGFTYTRRGEHGTQEPVATVRIGRGSCRDFALLMIEAVRSLGLAARFSTSREIESAFTTLVRDRADALFVAPDSLFGSQRVQLATLAARYAIPTACSVREQVEAGGLMSYGTDLVDAFRQTGVYTGQILKGAKPADLPVLQSTKFEFVINLQTARALGLEVPNSLQLLADEVIE